MDSVAVSISKMSRKLCVLAASTIALSMILLESALMPIVLPTLQDHMGLTVFQVQWLINAYFLTSAAMVLIGGKLADIIGYRRAFVIGAAGFAISNVIVGVSHQYWMMLMGRIAQGASAALVGPTGFAMIFHTFPPKERGRAIGISAGFSSLFLAIGPVLSAIFIEFSQWRAIFCLFLPLALAAILLAFFAVEKSQEREEKVDFISLMLMGISISALVISLMEFRGWENIQAVLAFGCLGFLALVALYFRNKREGAFIDLSLFKNCHFTTCLAVTFLTWIMMMNPIFWSLFLQKSLFCSPVETAAYIVVSALPVVFIAPASGLMADKMGAQKPILLGLITLIVSVVMLGCYTLYGTMFYLIFGFGAFGIGTALMLTPVGNLALARVPSSMRGQAAGIYNTMRYLGSSFGVAIFGFVGYYFRNQTFDESIASINGFKGFLFKDAYYLLEETVGMESSLNLDSLRSVFLEAAYSGFHAINICNGFITLLALLLTLVYLKDYRESN